MARVIRTGGTPASRRNQHLGRGAGARVLAQRWHEVPACSMALLPHVANVTMEPIPRSADGWVRAHRAPRRPVAGVP